MTFGGASDPGVARWRLAVLFFLHSLAPGMWTVPMGNVLAAGGHGWAVPWAFAISPVAALLSPLAVGALADRNLDAGRLLAGLCGAGAVFLLAAFWALAAGFGPVAFLWILFLHQLCFVPTWALVAAIAFANGGDPGRDFPLLRVWATIGWMVAGWMVSFLLGADASPASGVWGAAALAACALFALTLPATPPPAQAGARSGQLRWFERIGLDALDLFRSGDHRVFLVATMIFAIPISAFFPYAPQTLVAAGARHPTALMTTGQFVEIIVMLFLGGWVTRFRVKWLLAAGMAFGVLRYGMMAAGAWWTSWWAMIPGIAMHGLVFTLYYVTSQIFLEIRVGGPMRARAQALLTTASGGVGVLTGMLICGGWRGLTLQLPLEPARQWAVFWGGLALLCAVAFGYFITNYRGRAAGS